MRETGAFIGKSAALSQVHVRLTQVARSDLTVLILGETGTGKGLAARRVHELSARRSEAFIQVNCGAIPEALVESELFGHEKGAFSGAHARKPGKIELAAGGTLFLDEIGDMPLEAQVKLLRLLEEREFERVGGTEVLKADVRVLVATNRELAHMVKDGQFREDLFFRIQVFPISMPPLRQRREDIPLLVECFIDGMEVQLDKNIEAIDAEALGLLKRYDWPGNIRELKHTVERAAIVCRGGVIRARDIALMVGEIDDDEGALVTLEEYERRYILEVLEHTGWVIRGEQGAAAVLGLKPGTLYSRMKKLQIQRPSVACEPQTQEEWRWSQSG